MHRRFALTALVAGLLIGQAGTSSANTVYGNLGTSGTSAVGGFNEDTGPNANPVKFVAQGFSAASPNLSVSSISMWLFGDPSQVTLGIFADNAGSPAASPLFTSNTQEVGGKDLYTFGFSGANLSNGVNYWVSPVNSDVSWYLAGGAPTGQNGSGYTYVATKESSNGTSWTPATTNAYSMSIAAVPEPSSLAIAGAGIVLAGLAVARRRRVPA